MQRWKSCATGKLIVVIPGKDINGAPKFNRNTDWDWSDRARGWGCRLISPRRGLQGYRLRPAGGAGGPTPGGDPRRNRGPQSVHLSIFPHEAKALPWKNHDGIIPGGTSRAQFAGVPRTETSGMATGLPRRSRNANGCGLSCSRSPRPGQPNDEQEQLTYAGGASAWKSASPDERLTGAGGAPAWTSPSPRQATTRQREPCHALSPGRREQGLVEKAEEGPGQGRRTSGCDIEIAERSAGGSSAVKA
jgi:hypothetical protein